MVGWGGWSHGFKFGHEHLGIWNLWMSWIFMNIHGYPKVLMDIQRVGSLQVETQHFKESWVSDWTKKSWTKTQQSYNLTRLGVVHFSPNLRFLTWAHWKFTQLWSLPSGKLTKATSWGTPISRGTPYIAKGTPAMSCSHDTIISCHLEWLDIVYLWHDVVSRSHNIVTWWYDVVTSF